MEDKEIEEIILEPDPARVMEGLRDTGYEFNTAMADLVDNSIAANASKIYVNVILNPIGEVNVYIADNGCGMDLAGLKNAMKYGSARRNDPSSLGKFGLGLKTASTAFCRKLSLISKGSNNEYNKVQWDIDEICKINKWKLLTPPIEDDEKEILERVTNGGNGTLVVWDKVDRLMKSYSKDANRNKAFDRMIEKLKKHFSMVYERFLDENYAKDKKIEIYVNDELIKPWDPFCKLEPNTKSLVKKDVKVELPNGKQTSFHVEAWLLPRVEEFSDPKAKSEAKISNDMEGFYVYRENRLIYNGGWLDMFISDPHISLLRVDFSFDHTLDEYFNVDIKKSKILLNEEIFDYLKESFLPAPRREAAEIYRKGQTKQIQNIAIDAHNASNNNINEKAKDVEQSKVDIIDSDKGKVKISNSQGTVTSTLKIITESKPGQHSVIPVNSIDGGNLWEPTLVDGNHAVSINQSHEYYTKVYAPNLNNSTLIVGMDSLLWALAEAELSTYNDLTKEQYIDMRYQVSKILRKLVKDLPDPDDENYDINK